RQLRSACRPAVAAESLHTADPGDGPDLAVEADPADAVVVAVRDVQRAVGPHGDAHYVAELRTRGRTVVAAEAEGAGAGERGDDAVRRNLAHAEFPGVGNVDGPVGRDRHAPRTPEVR